MKREAFKARAQNLVRAIKDASNPEAVAEEILISVHKDAIESVAEGMIALSKKAALDQDSRNEQFYFQKARDVRVMKAVE